MKHKFLTGAVLKDFAGLGDRQIRVRASTPTVDRVGDVMIPKGCVVRGADVPVLLDHGRKVKDIVGRAVITVMDDGVDALITFAEEGKSVDADDACYKYKSGLATDVSIGFKEIDADRNKTGGFLVKQWELLEISLVVIACNPDATVIERSFDPARTTLKTGASRNLPVAADTAWDAVIAKHGILDRAGLGGDEPDTTFARKGFLVYDAARAESGDAYRIPFAKMIGDRLTVTKASLAAAAAELRAADFPDDVAEKAQAVIAHYEDKMKKSAPRFSAKSVKVKGLWAVARLADLLESLGWLEEDVEWEAEYEGDGSQLPAMLGQVMQAMGAALIAMTQEEVAELLGEEIAEEEMGKALPAAAFAKIKALPTPFAKALAVVRIKEGRAFSSANAKTLRDNCKAILAAHDAIFALVGDDDDSGDTPDDEAGSDTGKAAPAVLTKRRREYEYERLQAD